MKARIAFLLVLFTTISVYSEVPPQDEKLLNSLIKKGIICKGLSYGAQQEALRIYLHKKSLSKKNLNNKPSKKSDSASSEACISPPENNIKTTKPVL